MFHMDGMVYSILVILPIVVIAISTLPIVLRQTRTSVLEIKNEDYIRTARAKGSNRKEKLYLNMS